MYLRPTSPFEILCVLKQLNCNKSYGLDGLAAEAIAPALYLQFNACFENGFFPTCWKEAKVVSVFKSGDRRKLTNYKLVFLGLRLGLVPGQDTQFYLLAPLFLCLLYR